VYLDVEVVGVVEPPLHDLPAFLGGEEPAHGRMALKQHLHHQVESFMPQPQRADHSIVIMLWPVV
jgi:hypothetical protein